MTPQAVFTSFKLPKPGQSNPAPTSAGSASHLQSSSEQPLLPNRFLHGATSPSGGFIMRTDAEGGNGNKMMSAPLGGLPAMADQLAEMPKR